MLRQWILGCVSAMAVAVFVLGTPDDAWARRCCRQHRCNRGCQSGCGYGGGMWGGSNSCCGSSFNTGCSSGGCGVGGCGPNGCGVNGAVYNGNMTSPTVANPGTYTNQPYSTGYAPLYDGNGNLINNGAIQNPSSPAPAPNATAPAPNAAAPAPAPGPEVPTPVKNK